MTEKERIQNSEVYRFFVRKPNYLEGSELTPMQLVEALVNAKIVSEKARAVNMVCEYLKKQHDVSCDDEHLYKVVKTAYEKVEFYERKNYDFSNVHPCCTPWYQRLFQMRMKGEEY